MAGALVLLGSAQVYGWSELINENVLVFDDQGEIQSSYHLGNWTSQVTTSPPLVFLQHWNTGSPPVAGVTDTMEIPLLSNQTAVPNMTSGASNAPLVGVPNVSLYSFDTAIFPTRDPGTVPGIAASPSSGTYNHTLAVEIHAYAAIGTPDIEIFKDGAWQLVAGNPYTLYVVQNTTINVRAVNGTEYSPVTTLDYTITQPYTVDSDGNGIPDVWEVIHGLNPLDPGSGMKDSDGDGMSDIDEILRGSDPNDKLSLPGDTDGDGWSDWDEARRGTLPDSSNSKPVASRLYEVEAKSIWGNAQGPAGPYPLGNPYTFTTLIGQQRYGGAISTYGNFVTSRIPLGDELVFRAADQNVPELIVKKYLASVPDPTPADLTDDTWTTPEEWQAAWEDYLTAHLAITISDFDVVPQDLAPLTILERQLGILSNLDLLKDELPVDPENPDPLVFYAFSEEGQQPDQGVIQGLREYLNAESVSTPRTINQLLEDIEAVLAQTSCTTFSAGILSLYNNLSGVSVVEDAAAFAREQEGTYLAGLSLQYSFADLGLQGFTLFRILDPLEDLDIDGLTNAEEVPVAGKLPGLSNPFIADTDLDGLIDGADNCPRIVNPGQFDLDGDGLGDACDPDIDNDDLENGLELAFGSSPYLADTDGDGIGDNQEWLARSDPGVGLLKVAGLFPSVANANGGTQFMIYGSGFGADQGTGSVTIDGLSAAIVSWNETILTAIAPPHVPGTVDVVVTNGAGSFLALSAALTYVADADGDGVPDSVDVCPGFDDNLDADGDGVPDGCDVCAGINTSGDTDGDAVCNDLDTDDDNDGISDAAELAAGADPLNPALCGDADNDTCDDCSIGVDGFGLQPDNNPADDGIDSDTDGMCDAGDLCPGFSDAADADSDTVPDGCDICSGFDDRVDFDGDGEPDGCDTCPLTTPIRVLGKSDYWQELQTVYENDLVTSDTVQIQSSYAYGLLILNLAKEVTIRGGFNCDFTDNSGIPTVIQSLTIDGESGPVTIDNIEIR
ncbi:MAG: IPT/TIG domain-containing protein [Proteobacteria bacterium]|nr:IPT/TIG domain-containing protein [Pseudomonadota bacterium]